MGLLSSWSAVDWVILVVSLVTLAYLYSTWTFSHWEKRGVHSARNPLPLVGNMKETMMGRKAIGDVFVDIYKELKGSQFGGFFRFREPAIMICDPELIKSVMVKDFPSFHDNDIDVTIDVDPMFGRNPFALKGNRWKTVRSQLTPAFTPGKIKPLFPLINEVCRDLVEYLGKEDAEQEGFDAKELSSKFTTNVVATCAYGLNGNSFTDPKAAFREMGRNIMAKSLLRNIQLAILLFAPPKLAKCLKLRMFNETVTNFFRSVVKDAMDHREKNGVTRNDFLQMLMQLKAKGQVDEDDGTDKPQNEKFTDEDVAAQALTFFTDGFETSATALCFALYELAVNQDVQYRLRVEIDSALKNHGGKLTYEMLQEVPYLDMVLAEALRKYPPVTLLTRRCTKPYELPTSSGVYRVEVGTCVALPILALHSDPDYYPDPERFDPERFTEEGKASRHPYTYLPFGGGPRLCIGNRFARTQVKAGLAAIVSNFELQLCERTPVPIILDPTSFVPLAKNGVWLKFIKRANS